MTNRHICYQALSAGLLLITATASSGSAATPQASPATPEPGLIQGERLPTDKRITPNAAPGSTFVRLNPKLPGRPDYRADHAISTAISPDGQTMLVLTSGFNRLYDNSGERIQSASNEYVFVYDISAGTPRKIQVIQVANTYAGIAWNPKPQQGGEPFYVSGGVDDNIHSYTLHGGQYQESGGPIALGHDNGNGYDEVEPIAAGLAVSPDGSRLLVTNFENDSVSLIDLADRAVIAEQDLRPGKINPARVGVPGGEYPAAVIFAGPNKAYVSSQRDREIDVVNIQPNAPFLSVARRIPTRGQPTKMVLNKSATRLYVANDNSDTVAVVDTRTDHIVQRISTVAPKQLFANPHDFKGAGPNSLRLSPDEHFLFVSNGGENTVAVIRLAGQGVEPGALPIKGVESANDGDGGDDEPSGANTRSRVIGLIPTGWFPTSVNVSAHGRRLYVVNGKSNAGPNPQHCFGTNFYEQLIGPCRPKDQYIWQLEKAGLQSLPMPDARQLGRLTRQAAYNNHFLNRADYGEQQRMMAFLHRHIKHVIYVVKENRTYDQILGDLGVGNGDPNLALLAPYMPNHHRLARQFVDLDNLYASGEVSNSGWNWSTAARSNDYVKKTVAMHDANRGFPNGYEGFDRNVDVGIPSYAQRKRLIPQTPDDRDILPGGRNIGETDGPGENQNVGKGYLWNSALQAGLSFRNYGSAFGVATGELVQNPYAAGIRQNVPAGPALLNHTDIYYRAYDNKYPDLWREEEWAREFDRFVANGNLPSLELLRLPHDHTGSFSDAVAGVNTVATQAADNDYAIARLIQRVAHSPYKNNTLIFVIEDDAQDGPDHVDAHRTVGFVAGPYVKQHQVVSHNYNTVNMLRTIEDVLGMQPMGLNDALAAPMTDVFDTRQQNWTYDAVVPPVLRTTALALPPRKQNHTAQNAQSRVIDRCFARSRHSASYWARVMRGQDFADADELDTPRYNRALWTGFTGKDTPYPARSGQNLRHDRQALLMAHHAHQAVACRS